jgi:predicted nucleic acid-binding protein
MGFLLDTNVVSELRKGQRCDRGVAAWFADVEPEDVYLSVVTIGELRKGIENIRRRDAPSADSLEKWFQGLVTTHRDRILPIDQGIAEVWGRFNVPDPLPVIDGLIAATAQVHNLTLVSRNLEDVSRTGVACLNPFSA